MMDLELLTELSSDWEEGELRWEDAYPVLLDLLAQFPVSTVLERLSDDLRQHFELSLEHDFDNDAPVEEIIWIDSARGDYSAKELIVARAREWFASKRN